jgi:hypothetical protein
VEHALPHRHAGVGEAAGRLGRLKQLAPCAREQSNAAQGIGAMFVSGGPHAELGIRRGARPAGSVRRVAVLAVNE